MPNILFDTQQAGASGRFMLDARHSVRIPYTRRSHGMSAVRQATRSRTRVPRPAPIAPQQEFRVPSFQVESEPVKAGTARSPEPRRWRATWSRPGNLLARTPSNSNIEAKQPHDTHYGFTPISCDLVTPIQTAFWWLGRKYVTKILRTKDEPKVVMVQ
ncbi:hypothetical protein FIBSPDRAFT_884781 [Athelia psychrophila]|uniref:Uncharacterized protein n=1 Tax=Athelia psychrophila TaxID=1759441 RepID=A0A166SS11_9AGAM|nr:hypothetical protein FIBSPDRAFT_884781 [Fibularhizoctonia sp. CBS 109695]